MLFIRIFIARLFSIFLEISSEIYMAFIYFRIGLIQILGDENWCLRGFRSFFYLCFYLDV